jgi:hypothetical protein
MEITKMPIGIQTGSSGVAHPQSLQQMYNLGHIVDHYVREASKHYSGVSFKTKISSTDYPAGVGLIDFGNGSRYTGEGVVSIDNDPILMVTRVHCESGADASKKWFHKNFWYETIRATKDTAFTHLTFVSCNDPSLYDDLKRIFHVVVNRENSNHGFNTFKIGKNVIMISDCSFTFNEIGNTVRETLMDCAEYHNLCKKL